MADYEGWFCERQLRDALHLPGMMSIQHFVNAGIELRHSPVPTPHDLLLYTVVTDDPGAVRDAISHRAATGQIWPGPDLAQVRTATYRAFRPAMNGAGGEPVDARGETAESYLVVAFGDALAGQDDTFNDWYDKVHEPELMSHPGVVRGQRAERTNVQLGPAPEQNRYLMLQTIVTKDLPAVFREVLAGGPPSPALDRTRGHGYTYRAVSGVNRSPLKAIFRSARRY